MARRRKTCLIAAALILLVTLLAVEHPSVRALKDAVAALGIVDSRYTLMGMTDVRSVDHVRGDLSSPVVLVEYSDFECLMCAVMQETLDRIVAEQPVALVSRHMFPETSRHSFDLAVAAECVGKHGDDAAYFAFARHLYGEGWGRGIDDALSSTVASLGVSLQDFHGCIAGDERVRRKVRGDSAEGWRLGARGTPYIVVIYEGKPIGISYANTYDNFLERVTGLIADAQ